MIGERYRAWDKLNECWVNLFKIQISVDGSILAIQGLDGEIYGLHQVTLERSIGIRDKDDAPIFAGDILEFSDKRVWYKNNLIFKSEEEQNEIISDYVNYPMERRIVHADWESRDHEWLYPGSDFENYWKKIGNIHEDQDIAKGIK